MEKVTLFFLERQDIRISMSIYFKENGELFFDGYDIGKTVEKMWGDADYEYTYTIESVEVDRFYKIFSLRAGDRAGLLQILQDRFSGNNAYSLFGDFMKSHDIKYESFTWR
jgi:hypothetical protein